ncbi:PAS domain-containing protein [Salinigranum marinum]|uniref:PAS domain-containing protein n=1 Tax=Salinigranum marinum TaxID=1515595 RepID=UPI002989C765|nr:PAS domain-containing protein [Salinigranum marinum]
MSTIAKHDDIDVLHVDDDPAFGDLVATFLERHDDIVVHGETDPEVALERLDAVDCVVSDFDMPETDGLTLLRRVRDRHPELPFVLFTGKGNEEIASEAIAAGVSGYLQKGGGSERYELLVNRIRTVVSEARANERAREATERLQEVYERTTDGVIAVDREWRYTYANARAEEILGAASAELLGTEVWSAFPGLVGTRFETELRRAMETGEEVSFDAYFDPLGTHFAVRAFPGDDGLSIYVRDVTDEERTREKLAAERRLLDAALDAIDDVFYVLNGSGERLVRWNDRLAALTGRTDVELASTPVTELFVPADRTDVTRTIERVLDGEDVSGVARFDTPDDPRLYEFRTVPLHDESGELVGVCGIGRDVTTQREREAHLERVETIVEALGDPVYTTDAVGKLTYVNDAFVEATGYDFETALGADAAALLKTEEGREAAFSAIRRARETDSPERFEFDLQTADGDAIPCEDHLSLLPTDADFRGTAGVIRDISRRKDREATLRRQRDQLDKFAAVVSHDLRNPLSVALGHVQLALETESSERLDTAEDALERMDRMVDELLLLARTGAVVNDPEPVTIDAVARDAWAVTDTGDATLSLDDGLPAVSADPSRLAGLFENLFRNSVEHGSTGNRTAAQSGEAIERSSTSSRPETDDAVEHGSTNGRSQIDSATDHPPASSQTAPRSADRVEVRVGVLENGAGRGFFVEDDGPGFGSSVDDPDGLFDPGVSTATDGTGYGLTIVRDVAEAHGWTVTATAGDDGGARFEFRVRTDS